MARHTLPFSFVTLLQAGPRVTALNYAPRGGAASSSGGGDDDDDDDDDGAATGLATGGRSDGRARRARPCIVTSIVDCPDIWRAGSDEWRTPGASHVAVSSSRGEVCLLKI